MTTDQLLSSGANQGISDDMEHARLLFDVYLGGKLDLFLDLLSRGHAQAATDLTPQIQQAVVDFRTALGENHATNQV